MVNTDPRKALYNIFKSLQTVFKDHSRTARKKAWKAVQTEDGKHKIRQLLNSPDRPLALSGLPKLLDFKEWLESNFS